MARWSVDAHARNRKGRQHLLRARHPRHALPGKVQGRACAQGTWMLGPLLEHMSVPVLPPTASDAVIKWCETPRPHLRALYRASCQAPRPAWAPLAGACGAASSWASLRRQAPGLRGRCLCARPGRALCKKPAQCVGPGNLCFSVKPSHSCSAIKLTSEKQQQGACKPLTRLKHTPPLTTGLSA